MHHLSVHWPVRKKIINLRCPSGFLLLYLYKFTFSACSCNYTRLFHFFLYIFVCFVYKESIPFLFLETFKYVYTSILIVSCRNIIAWFYLQLNFSPIFFLLISPLWLDYFLCLVSSNISAFSFLSFFCRTCNITFLSHLLETKSCHHTDWALLCMCIYCTMTDWMTQVPLHTHHYCFQKVQIVQDGFLRMFLL